MLSRIPWWHWVIVGTLSLALAAFVRLRKKCSAYGAIAFGLTVFMGLLLLEAAVFLRYFGYFPHGYGFTVGLDRLIHLDKYGWTELISNVVAFIPFGFFLSELLASAKRFGAGRRIGLVTLAGFGLSLCIEFLQLVLRVGFFEVTDLVMNTVGTIVGAGVSILIRIFLRSLKSC